jgi:2-polyprenyl-3-methyl-5-hydroxy-6-metoxy-1,4-benzoquinol methylase
MLNISHCQFCNCDDLKVYIQLKDYSISKEEYKILECTCCGLLQTTPQPQGLELSKYYQSDDYISHSDTKKDLLSSIYHFVRSYTLFQKRKWVFQYIKKGKILDYGCGTGYFMNVFQKGPIESDGLEIDDNARKLAEERNKKKVFQTINQVPNNTYQCITMWHVLEHVDHLSETIIEIKNRLTSNGYLIIAVPNPKSYDAKLYKNYWAAYDVPRHFYHFTSSVIHQIARKNNFKIIEEKSMYFDAIYISMLSEKYKGGSSIKGIINGLISNIKGFVNNNTSSKVYILKRND